MLDKQKVMQELLKSLPALFKENVNEHKSARALFSWLQSNHQVQETFVAIARQEKLPSWEGSLDAAQTIVPHEHPYSVLAVDGSQIYPDRHQGMACYLLNAGAAHFIYDRQSSVRLFSAPSLCTQTETTDMSEDMVNCHRAELEFEVGLRESVDFQTSSPTMPHIFLCDGSLIFWHLESKHPAIKERFLKKYIEQLDAFYQQKIITAGYISSPKSKELISLLRACIKLNLVSSFAASSFESVVDTAIAELFLNAGQCSTLFIHNSALAESYPPHLRPCFVYMHTGDEIARVEVPFWVGQDAYLLERTLRIIQDQCHKGDGYPIALAEAHEQAVVSNQDRQFFFDMLHKMAFEQNYRLATSQKSLKKRRVGV